MVERVKPIAELFELAGEVLDIVPYGNGHINDTYRVTTTNNGDYIMQRINTNIFKKPEQVMENIYNVTKYLREIIKNRGGNPERETLTVVPSKKGEIFVTTAQGDCYRMFLFIRDALSYDKVEKPEDFYESAVSFGRFQSLLADFPAETLYETIVDFHNTVWRFDNLKKAVEEDVCGRAASVQEEIKFAMEREAFTHTLVDLLAKGEIPLRVTHNDTKLNNIMMDNETHKGICVVDLDTVMPGLSVNDFGDSIRFGANTAAEDETDLSKVSLSLELYELYVKGYLEGCGGSLTEKELEMLPVGAKMMTFECGMRFLTDYLQGDTYFKIHRPDHNLDRCRTQFGLVADMENKWTQMQEIVQKYA